MFSKTKCKKLGFTEEQLDELQATWCRNEYGVDCLFYDPSDLLKIAEREMVIAELNALISQSPM